MSTSICLSDGNPSKEKRKMRCSLTKVEISSPTLKEIQESPSLVQSEMILDGITEMLEEMKNKEKR